MLRPSVETLFERFRSGDAAALGAVFDRTAPELLVLARHLSRDQASAEDLVQGTYLAAIESAASWDRRQPLVPWLVGILANLARMERRREARRVPPERLATGAAEDPAAACETRELGESLDRVVRALPEPYRGVLVLHLLHGLSAGEIADALGSPGGTVRSQITRGLELLRRALPVGLTATAVAVVTSPAALAAMRARVIERAAEACGAAASGVGSLLVLGGFAMKTKSVVLVFGALLLAGAGAWLGLSRESAASPAPGCSRSSRARTFPTWSSATFPSGARSSTSSPASCRAAAR